MIDETQRLQARIHNLEVGLAMLMRVQVEQLQRLGGDLTELHNQFLGVSEGLGHNWNSDGGTNFMVDKEAEPLP